MSKLSRFKRAVLKLPPMTKKVENLNDTDSNEDFKDHRPILKKPLVSHVSVVKSSESGEGAQKSRKKDVESVYFNTEGRVSTTKSFDGESQELKEEEAEKVLKSKRAVSKKKDVDTNDTSIDTTEKESEGETADPSSKVVCPFCWKKLSDKLTGTTHVKSCGKNLPTERIFEALQLHEKQVKEWEGLGIAYPGFATSTNNVKGSKPKVSKPRSRTKKMKEPEIAEMDLAMALSVSLHEEIETRKLKEKEFLVENGLEKELDLLDPPCGSGTKNKNINLNKEIEPPPPVSYRQKPEKKPKTKTANPETQGGKRRGKKDFNLKETRLYTITETERQNIINDRVGLILEERLNANLTDEQFYVRDKLELPVVVPKNLIPFHKEKSPLWKLAELDNESNVPNNFIIQDVLDSKARNERDIANKAASSPERDKNKASSSGNRKEEIEKPNPSLKINNQSIIPKNDAKGLFIRPTTSLSKQSPSSTTSNTSNLSINGLHESINSTIISQDSSSKRKDKDNPYPQVVEALLKMLEKRAFTDIVLYGREEKPVKCHRLILTARCPKILEDVAQCRTSAGKVRELISLVEYSHVVVKAFVKFVYTGRIRSCLNSEELTDLKELAEKYDMELLPDPEIPPPAKRIKTTSAFTQTETENYIAPPAKRIKTTFAFTQTEIENFTVDKEANDSSDDIFDESDDNLNKDDLASEFPSNIEIKKGKCFDKNRDETIKNDKSSNSIVEISEESITNKHVNKISNCVRNSSNGYNYNDMFEPNAQVLPHDDWNVSEDLFGDEEDDEFLNKIADDMEFPTTQSRENYNKKKRTRSVSQFSSSSNCSFTATQAVQYWKKQMEKIKLVDTNSAKEASDVEDILDNETIPTPRKAKKHKFDSVVEDADGIDNDKNPLDENIGDSDIEVIVIDDDGNSIDRDYGRDNKSLKSNSPLKNNNVDIENENDEDLNPILNSDMSLSWEDTYVAAKKRFDDLEQENIMKSALGSPVSRSLSSTPKKQSVRKSNNTSLRLSVENVRNFDANSTSPSYSPVQSFLQSAKSKNKSRMSFLDHSINNQTFNAFGDQDDSMFANIPEEVFNVPDNDLYVIPELSPIIPSPVSSKPKRKARGKPQQSQKQNNEKEPKKKTASKSKPSAKIKLPKTLHRTYSYSQEPQSRSPPTSIAVDSSPTPNGRSPMLNYSTIDTPILKSELKRYGLKPLPRTKAKVILRHIYKETHKDLQ